MSRTVVMTICIFGFAAVVRAILMQPTTNTTQAYIPAGVVDEMLGRTKGN